MGEFLVDLFGEEVKNKWKIMSGFSKSLSGRTSPQLDRVHIVTLSSLNPKFLLQRLFIFVVDIHRLLP